jgi:hypothetical protein
VVLNGACELIDGQAFFDVRIEIDLVGIGETWIGQGPIRIESRVGQLPPDDVRYESPFVAPVVLEDQLSGEPRATILYLEHHAGPSFPPEGPDCADALLTADLELFGPGTTANLIGFGPAAVQRGATIPGGFCLSSAEACEEDSDCTQPFDACARARLDTEIFRFDLGGFDLALGSWQTSVTPGLGDSDCCETQQTPGCSDPTCESFICDLDPFCCTNEWDFLCASLAESEPICADNCFDPGAVPSLGTVQSIFLDRTYPAASSFEVFLRLDSAQQAAMHNEIPILLTASEPLGNLPADPGSMFQYSGTPIPMLNEIGTPLGQISNVVHTVQPPVDCDALPLAADHCLSSWFGIELSLPPCAAETLWLPGIQRVLLDDPAAGPGLGQDVIDALLAHGEFAGVSDCSGPLVLRFSSSAASSGSVSSLTPEEFFPADSFFDVLVEIQVAGSTLSAGPLHIATSINSLPPDPDETYFDDGSVVDLLDESLAKVGEILALEQRIGLSTPCPSGSHAAIVFRGPTSDDLDVGIPLGGGGVAYDVVRGDLDTLVSTGGSFASATCLASDVPAGLVDTDAPASGDGFYYVSRDGFGAFNGTWNGPGTEQVADRNGGIPSCP